MRKSLTTALVSILLSSQVALAQNGSIIYLKNGSSITGIITEKNYQNIKVKISDKSEIIIPVNDIDSIDEYRGKVNINYINNEEPEIKTEQIRNLESQNKTLEKDKNELKKVIKLEDKIVDNKQKIENLKTVRQEVWFENPNYTRMFFAPTAKPLKQGDGYLQDIDIFGFAANYGITDNISIGGMASLIPGVRTDQQILAFTPKLGVNVNKNLSVGGGLLYVSGAGLAQVGVAYGIVTYGSADTNLTLGIGGAYGNISKAGFFPALGQEAVVKNAGALVTMVGGMHRIGEHISVVSENWMINNNVSNDSSYLFSYGFRFFWEKSSWDIAVAYPVIPNMTSYPLPYIDYVWHF